MKSTSRRTPALSSSSEPSRTSEWSMYTMGSEALIVPCPAMRTSSQVRLVPTPYVCRSLVSVHSGTGCAFIKAQGAVGLLASSRSVAWNTARARLSKRGNDGNATDGVPGAVLGRLPRSVFEQADLCLSDLRSHPDLDRARKRVWRRGSGLVLLAWPDVPSVGGSRRAAVPRPAPHDPIPPEVPALVVRLEPGAAAVHQSSAHLCPADG